MRAMLKISLLLNFFLIGSLLLMLAAWRDGHRSGAAAVEIGSPALRAEPGLASPAALPKINEPHFNWSQVESTDYPTYIANLQVIGCPRQTIRDIITADLDSLYSRWREPFEKALAGSAFSRRSMLESRLKDLRDQESSIITALLGSLPIAENLSVAVAKPDATSPSPRRDEQPTSITIPLAFQQVDVSALKLNSGQLQAIDELRQRFIEEVGGLNQDPHDPDYAEKWLKAQPELDNLMRGMIGVNAYQNYELTARANSEQPTPSGP